MASVRNASLSLCNPNDDEAILCNAFNGRCRKCNAVLSLYDEAGDEIQFVGKKDVHKTKVFSMPLHSYVAENTFSFIVFVHTYTAPTSWTLVLYGMQQVDEEASLIRRRIYFI